MIQQNVAGRPVTVFRFPPRTRLKALSHATVSVNIPHLFQNSFDNAAFIGTISVVIV